MTVDSELIAIADASIKDVLKEELDKEDDDEVWARIKSREKDHIIRD
jgi:hypothetical protein